MLFTVSLFRYQDLSYKSGVTLDLVLELIQTEAPL